ncbi:MAG: hypothetical protein ACQEWL_05775 [Pseudomonadota bacterium]|uniref:hypothetical protein n=1 Tax=Providencia stuartii TaxID=588 RepID=UPI00300C0F1D
MIEYINNDTIIVNNDIYLIDTATKETIITSRYNWEEWVVNSNGETVSYRLILGSTKNQYGRLFLIVNFSAPISNKSLLYSWHLAPEKLINGTQNKPKGKVTHALNQWFKDETGVNLPIISNKIYIDSSYDPWNSAGLITCNYRSSFQSEESWKEFNKQSNK